MTTSATPSDPKPAGDDRNLVAVDENYVALTFEEKLHLIWKHHGNLIVTLCVVILIGILAAGGWQLYQAHQEKGLENEYAAASTPEKLAAFAAANPGHALGGLALLRLADDAYAAGKFADAQANYTKAADELKTGPFAARARLGAAMAVLGQDKTAEGEAALKQISADTNQLKGIRAEATYHLTSLAAAAGRADDVTKFSDQLMQIDPASPWTQRALALRANGPAPAASDAKKEAVPAAPMISLPAAGK